MVGKTGRSRCFLVETTVDQTQQRLTNALWEWTEEVWIVCQLWENRTSVPPSLTWMILGTEKEASYSPLAWWDEAQTLRHQLQAKVSPLPAETELYPSEFQEETASHRWVLECCHNNYAVSKYANMSGKSVRIAVVDTGYTEHDQLNDGTPDRLRVLEGKNYVETSVENDPLDRSPTQVPAVFGHGTAVASVMMSGHAAWEAEEVYGIAPDAEVIPYRVSPCLSLTDPISKQATALAIEHATAAGCEVIFVGVQSFWAGNAIRKAVHAALDRGVIVVAGAGEVFWDQAPAVVLAPARFPGVVGVAACDATRRVCPWSARGTGVDLSAPGEHVWASEGLQSDGKHRVRRWSGTAFSAAIVAGSVARWLQRWRGDQLFESTGNKLERSLLFRQAVRNCSLLSPSGTNNEHQLWGAGVLDSEKLLSYAIRPLSVADRLLPDTFPVSHCDEFCSLVAPDMGNSQRSSSLSSLIQAGLIRNFRIKSLDVDDFLEEFGEELAMSYVFLTKQERCMWLAKWGIRVPEIHDSHAVGGNLPKIPTIFSKRLQANLR
jgi:hypothetical protein